MADVEFKIYIYIKPHTSDKILYRTFDAAQRACTHIDGEIEEWAAVEGAARLRYVCSWYRTHDGTFERLPLECRQ